MSTFSRRLRHAFAVMGVAATLLLVAGTPAWSTDDVFELSGKVGVESEVPATVIVDGRLVGPTPQWLALTPGTHMVEVRAPNYWPFITTVAVSDREVLTVDVDLQPVDPRARIIARSQESLPRPQWSPDGSVLAMVCDWERLFTYSLSHDRLAELARHAVAELALVGWSANGRAIAYEEFNGPGQWLVNRSGTMTPVNSAHGRRVRWAPNLQGALVSDASGLSWHASTGSGAQPPAGAGVILTTVPVSDAQVSPDGQFAVVVETGEHRPEQLTMCGKVYLINLDSGERKVVPDADACDDLARVSFSRRGQFLIAVNREGAGRSTYGLTVVDRNTGSSTVVDQVGLQDAFSYSWSPEDEWLVYAVTVADRNEICLWNSRTGAISRLDGGLVKPAAPAFMGNQTIIVCARGNAGDRLNVDLWILPVRVNGDDVIVAGVPQQIASGVFEPSVAVSPAGNAVVFTTSDGAVWIWRP